MTDRDAARLYKKAKMCALGLGFDDSTAEDLAQDAMIRMLNRPYGATVAQVVIDCIRKLYGRRKAPVKWLAESRDVDPWGQVHADMDLDDILLLFTERERKIVIDYFLLGCDTVEIARELDVTDTRVWQILREGLMRVRLRLKIECEDSIGRGSRE